MSNTIIPVSAPNLIVGIMKMKCPACREGSVFTDPNPYHWSRMGSMHEKCSVCGENFRHEPGFYFGAAYVSYGLMVGFLIIVGFLYYFIFQEIGENMLRLLSTGSVAATLVAPVIFRYSRIIYLYIIVRFKGKKHFPEKGRV
ncbi:MAG: DUF983 domain-containing protein [Bacteroidetes bacterium]|nr:DUF983 domain-containing protein [Bacteroidota bacterium]